MLDGHPYSLRRYKAYLCICNAMNKGSGSKLELKNLPVRCESIECHISKKVTWYSSGEGVGDRSIILREIQRRMQRETNF